MKTPYFQISNEVLDNNINAFKDALKHLWPNSKIAYSIKTNSLPWILEYMNQHGILAEAVSDEEYQLAQLCGYEAQDIIFNGPIKGESQFNNALESGSYINLDSAKDVELLMQQNKVLSTKVGLRLNLDPTFFNSNDIEFDEDGFRFGFSDNSGDLQRVINKLDKFDSNRNFGLHLHCNSITRSLDVYRSIASYAVKIIKKYQLKPSYIDIGGGFFGGVEGKPTAFDYISVIKEALKEAVDYNTTELIIEPGSAIIGSAIDLYTTVTDVRDTSHSRIVTTDGSRIHIDPLWKKSSYMYSLPDTSSEREILNKQIICGYTCMDHDRIMILSNVSELKTGDRIVYKRVGAYTVTFGGAFIRYFPEVYVNSDTETKKVRKRISVEDFFNIHNI